jgi:hypothetical protein
LTPFIWPVRRSRMSDLINSFATELVAQHIPQVAQHIPQVQSFLAAVVPAVVPAPAPPVAPAAPPVSTPMPAPANPQPKQPRNNPFLNTAAPASSGAAAPSANAVPQAPLSPLECLIPGCGQPVHVDASGVMSDYCSKKHREYVCCASLLRR